MITITNKLVISILFSPILTTVNNCCCFINAEQHCWNNSEQHCSFNNIGETIVNNIVRSTTLFSHDNRVVTPLFNQQCCNNVEAPNVLTKLFNISENEKYNLRSNNNMLMSKRKQDKFNEMKLYKAARCGPLCQ